MILVEFSELVQKQVKDLRKKYYSIPADISTLIEEIEFDPKNAVELGGNLYKKRFVISSKGKGKSGSRRAIYVLYQVQLNKKVVVVEVFDKSDKENISNARLKELKRLYKSL